MFDPKNLSGAVLPFETKGNKNKSPIVLVPGGFDGWLNWAPHARVLSRKHMVIRVQLLNMASAERNEILSKEYSVRSESVALKNTLDKIGVQAANLVGFSHGGEVSLDFALNYPDRIKTLALIEPTIYWIARVYGKFDEELQEAKKLFDFVKGFHHPPTEEDLISFLRRDNYIPPKVDLRSLPRWQVWNSHRYALMYTHTLFEHSDDLTRLQMLRDTPVLLVRGEDSPQLTSGMVDLLSDTISPNASILVLPDGRNCYIVAKAQFISSLEEFLRINT